jgi:methylglyoxal synthase
MIKENKVDIILFFCDTGKPNRRNAAVNQLIQLATDMNIVVSCNTATASLVLSALRVGQGRAIAGKGAVIERRGLAVAGHHKKGVALLLVS